MTTHTHKGHCQVCGRIHAVNNKSGNLAKHGYTVDWGFFNGTCTGSDRLPLEQDKSVTESSIEIFTARAERLAAITLEDIDVVHLTKREGRDYRGRAIKKTIECRNDAEVQAVNQWSDFAREAQNELRHLHRQAELLFSHVEDLKNLIETIHGQDLIPNVEQVERRRQEIDGSYKDGYAIAEQWKAEGFKTRVTRQKWGGIVVTGTKAAA